MLQVEAAAAVEVRLESKEEERTERWSFGRYLLTLHVFLLVMYTLPFFLVRMHDFAARSNTPYSLPLNYAYGLAQENADVVLFGDSTLLHGVDPSQMSRELGLKVINLPNTGATLRVVNELSLRRYLQTNRPPRLIVFYFAPWDADYLHTELPIGTYEGREVLAQQGTWAEIFAYARSHPSESLEFPFQFYLANSSWRAFFQQTYRYAGEEIARTQGHLTNPRLDPLSAPCQFPSAFIENLRFDSMKALGAAYGNSQTKILYFFAPVPNCLNASVVTNRSYSELPAAPPRALPMEMFTGSLLYLHPAPGSVPQVTEQLVEAVKPLLSGGRS